MPVRADPVHVEGKTYVHLTAGKVAIIESDDYPIIKDYAWIAIPSRRKGTIYTWYAVTFLNKRAILMHRLLLGLDYHDPRRVDHKDGDGLNNHRSNIRIASHAENMRNRKLQSNNTTGYRGVVFVGGKFAANIKYNRQWTYLGSFSNAIDAARAYDIKATELFGEFARLNLPKMGGKDGKR